MFQVFLGLVTCVLHVDSKINRSNLFVVGTYTTIQRNKQNGQLPRQRQTEQEGGGGLLMLMIMQRGRKLKRNLKKKKMDWVWRGRQACMQACSLSELKDPPPRSSHHQVEGGKMLLLNASLFSGTHCVNPSIKPKNFEKGWLQKSHMM